MRTSTACRPVWSRISRIWSRLAVKQRTFRNINNRRKIIMFRSFFFAGFECATGYNAQGEWIDQIAATHHDRHADEDYRRLHEIGIDATREAVRWPVVDRRG